MSRLSDDVRQQAVAHVRQHVDLTRIDEDAIRRSQDRFGLSVIEVAEILWQAFGPDGTYRPDAPLMRNLVDGEAGEALAYAAHQDFEVDDDAPVLTAGSLDVGGQRVRRLGLGGMRLVSASIVRGDAWLDALGLPFSPEENRHVLRNAIEACGIDYVDVARGYGPWEGAGEGVLRDWVLPDDDVLLSTKVGYGRDEDGAWFVDLSCERLAEDIRKSQAQFGRGVPLLYLVCRSTPDVPVRHEDVPLADRLAVMQRAVDDGLVERVGLANATADEIAQAADTLPLAAVQNRFDLDRLSAPAHRSALEACAERGLPFVTWGIFGEGARDAPDEALAKSARELSVAPRELCIALLLAASDNLIALPGPSRRETLYSCVRGANLDVPEEIVRRHIDPVRL